MNTPWGKSDSKIDIERGVSWVSTPSHGGLAITAQRAVQTLSGKAITISMCERYGTEFVNLPKTAYLFFEEDCLYAVAFYEHPEWYRTIAAEAVDYSNDQIKDQMAKVIRRWYPEYFAN